MGCNTSRLNDQPAVSLCRDRCKFLEEALRRSRALADAHAAYAHSLKALGPALRRFFDRDPAIDDERGCAGPDVSKPGHRARPASPDRRPSGPSPEPHIDFPSDSEDEREGFFGDGEEDVDLLHGIHPNHFHRQNPYGRNTPSPPMPPPSSTWDFLNFFEPVLDIYEMPKKEKEAHNQVALAKEEIHVSGEEKRKESSGSAAAADGHGNRRVAEITTEVEALFGRAAESGNEVLEMLDAADFRHFNKNYVLQGASSKILQAVTPSFSVLPMQSASISVSSTEKIGSVEGDSEVVSLNLSFTLKKLWMWEKKLCDEVKAEEKLRIMLARNCRQTTSWGEKGAEAGKLEHLLMTLSTRIKVAIQVIDRISVTVNELRDQELWPQINELITKLLGMWKAMLECHRCQFQAVGEARSSDAMTSNAKFSDAHLEAAIQLNIELQNWTLTFSNWITAQRVYARALNRWLLKYLPCEPEELPDGNSPTSAGPPPIFVICHQWTQAMDKVSETEVIDAMHRFFKGINQVVERHCAYLQRRQTADKDLEKKIKMLERGETRIQKMMQARGKMFLAAKNASSGSFPEDAAHQNNSLQVGLKQIFMALDRFCANTVQAYEELHRRLEEHRLATKEKLGGS